MPIYLLISYASGRRIARSGNETSATGTPRDPYCFGVVRAASEFSAWLAACAIAGHDDVEVIRFEEATEAEKDIWRLFLDRNSLS